MAGGPYRTTHGIKQTINMKKGGISIYERLAGKRSSLISACPLDP
jgi:hypothetical protein